MKLLYQYQFTQFALQSWHHVSFTRST